MPVTMKIAMKLMNENVTESLNSNKNGVKIVMNTTGTIAIKTAREQ